MPIYMTAKCEVKQEALEVCRQTIQEFVDDVHANKSRTLSFTRILYPNLAAPVEFTKYTVFTSTK